jgi:methionine synthase II (cobalamin-independent)
VRLALFDQEHAGIDIVTDGEQTRRHFVTTFIEGLDGVTSRTRRRAHPQPVRRDVPMVVGPWRAAIRSMSTTRASSPPKLGDRSSTPCRVP